MYPVSVGVDVILCCGAHKADALQLLRFVAVSVDKMPGGAREGIRQAEVDFPLMVFIGGEAALYQGGLVFDAGPVRDGGGVAEDEFVCPGRFCGNGEQEFPQADDRFFKADRTGRPVIAPIIAPIISLGRIAGDQQNQEAEK